MMYWLTVTSISVDVIVKHASIPSKCIIVYLTHALYFFALINFSTFFNDALLCRKSAIIWPIAVDEKGFKQYKNSITISNSVPEIMKETHPAIKNWFRCNTDHKRTISILLLTSLSDLFIMRQYYCKHFNGCHLQFCLVLISCYKYAFLFRMEINSKEFVYSTLSLRT